MQQHKKSLALILFSLILINSREGYSAITTDQSIERSQRLAEQSIERTQRLLELKREQEYVDEQLKYPMREQKEVKENKLDDLEDGKKYLFNQLRIVGGKGHTKKLEKILEKHKGTEMSKADIFAVVSELSNYYLEKGYVTTVVTVKEGNVKTGNLVFEVKEGKLKKLKLKGIKELSFKKKLKLFTAFPSTEGGILNLYDLDQGIENLSVGGWRSTMEIIPTNEYGYSDVVVDETYSWTGLSAGIDNSSYADLGREKVNVSLTQSNLLGINDTLSFNFIERLTEHRKLDKETNYDINYSFPFGYWKVAYNLNIGDSYNTIVSPIGTYKSESASFKHKFKLSRVIERSQNSKTTVNFALTLKDSENKIAGLVLDVNSKKYSYFTLGGNHVNRLWGGSLFVSADYERGVKWFSGTGDGIDPYGYKPQFDKFNLNLDWKRQMYLESQSYFEYKFSFGGSYSEDRLLSANKFNMGDEFTVRGFKESSVSGDKGAYINNTLSYSFSREKYPFLSKFTPFIGMDFGISKDTDIDYTDKIAGVSTGVSFYSNGIYASFIYSTPMRRSEGMPKETHPIYFSMSYTY